MKFDFKKVLPHLIAIVVFLLVSVVYTKPALDGKVLQQHDMMNWKGMSKDAENYKVKHGVYPEWTNSMFGGMPTFQIAFNNNAILPGLVPATLSLFLPTPTSYFFLCCICMYLLSQVLGLKAWTGIFGALAFAFATYNPVIIGVGHHTKMMSIAILPAILAGLYLIYDKRYWLGAAITSLCTAGLFAYTHYQVIYYFFIVIGFMGVAYWVTSIKAGQIKQMLIGTVVAAFSLGLGILANSVTLLTTMDYAKATIRDGSVLANDNPKTGNNAAASQVTSTGLDSSYAFSYSMGIAEPLVLAVPNLFGGSSNTQLPEDGKTMEALQDISAKMGPENAQQIAQGLGAYSGGIGGAGTSGPPYSGAIVCFLALFGLFFIDAKYKWWMASAVLLSIIMSWGGYFYAFNGFLWHHLPLYNKFRAPSMSLVIPQLLLPIMAMLTLQKLSDLKFDIKANKGNIKNGLIGMGALLVLILGYYFISDFLSANDHQTLVQINAAQMEPQQKQLYKGVFSAVASDRKTMAFHDILRMIFIVLLGAAVIYAFMKKWIKPVVAISILAAISFIDLITIDNKYLNSDSYQEANEQNGVTLEPELVAQPINNAILQDKGIYRVYDARQSRIMGNQRIGASAFNDASQAYHHNMIGGYHPAKLSIYQDLIENQIGKGNQDVFDMLNTKYFMVNDQRGGDSVIVNPAALGPAWFVKHIEYLDGPSTIMKRLDHFSPKDTAIVDKQFEKTITAQPQFDSAATIKNTLYDNDKLEYAISTKSNQFAVLSEVYYKNGWKAFVDGKETPIMPVDYVLRGINIPAGAQKLELEFAPDSYITGKKLTGIASILMLVLLLVGIYFDWKRGREKAV